VSSTAGEGPGPSKSEPEPAEEERSGDQDEIQRLIATTVSGLSRSSGDAVLASSLKRALIRKDPTFSEADYGFRAFGELLRHLESKHVIALSEGPAAGDPVVTLASNPDETEAFELLVKVVKSIEEKNGSPQLSGLKNQVRKAVAGVLREAVRLRRIPPVLQGRPGPWPRRADLGRRRQRLPHPRHSLVAYPGWSVTTTPTVDRWRTRSGTWVGSV
jgi:hypothetical protein